MSGSADLNCGSLVSKTSEDDRTPPQPDKVIVPPGIGGKAHSTTPGMLFIHQKPPHAFLHLWLRGLAITFHEFYQLRPMWESNPNIPQFVAEHSIR